MDVSCIILAGGRSTRMGRDKKFLKFRGKSFLERAVEVAKRLSDEVIISLGNQEQKAKVLDKGFRGVKIVVDHLQSKGPLVGLYNALKKCSKEYAVVMPCDSPLLNHKVFRSMIETSRGYNAVVPQAGEFIEPLLAVYRVKPMLEACEQSIKSCSWDAQGAVLKLKNIRYMKADMTSFLNVNTTEDLEKLLEKGVNMDVRTKGFHKRTPVDKALSILLREVKPLGAERVQLACALGRVLAQKVEALHDSPPFSRAAMDGYALKGENTFGASQTNPIYFKLKGQVLTGRPLDLRVHDFEAARIMTGGPMPRGANAIAMFEYVKELGEEIEVIKPVTPGKNVSLKGEDVRKGEVLLRKGREIKPQDIAITAAMGMAELMVYRQPTVAIIATGDELREPGSRLSSAEIYDANSHSLHALVKRSGGLPKICGIVGDDYEQLRGAVRKALSADLVLISGATSVGEKDFVPKVIAELGDVLVHGVAMRPGEPTGFGVVENKLVFMLPGYPVAAIFAYETFVRPALEKMQGFETSRRYIKITGCLKRKIASELGRRDYVRVKLDLTGKEPMVEPIRTSGSGIISSLVRADGFVIVPENTEGLEQGEKVEVNLF